MQSVTCPFCHRTIQPLELALRQSPHRDGYCERPVSDDASIVETEFLIGLAAVEEGF